MKVTKILGIVAAVAGGFVLFAALAAYLWLRSSLPQVAGNLVLGAQSGLAAPVEIFRDTRGVPHIRAKAVPDAYFALGFVHAQDRLWQMEAMRRAGAGRLAEILGPRLLPTDRLMRGLGLRHLAERQFDRLLPETQGALEAYARGVNAFLERHGGTLPIEFVLLGLKPEPWRPADSLVWGKLMALRLGGNWQGELLRARLGKTLSPVQIADLWSQDGPAGSAALGFDARGLAEALPEEWRRPPQGASNAWAVDGAHSLTGKPLLANDPHLGFEAPILWYLARIEAPGLDLAGATVPGVPFHVLGHNGRLAWGLSSTEADIADLFVEKTDPADPGRYLTPEGSLPFATRSETIRVRGGPDVALEVRETRHGPVISDFAKGAGDAAPEGLVLALSATFLRDGDLTPQALHGFSRATDWASFRAALADFHAPPQNVLYSDAGGAIAFQVAGKIPIRKAGQGWLPQPGWNGGADWTGFVPFRELPMALDPKEGHLVAANHKIVPSDYRFFLSNDWAPGYRALRIQEQLRASQTQSLDTFRLLQLDNLSLMARELLPLLSRFTPARTRDKNALRMLVHWNGEMSVRQTEPLIFTAWLRELNRLLYGKRTGEAFDEAWDLRPRFLSKVLREKPEWCDDPETAEIVEPCSALLERALGRALDSLEESQDGGFVHWRWGNVHVARFHHPLLAGMGMGKLEIATDGGDDTVSRGTSRIGGKDRPFDHVHGAGFRALYDLSDLKGSRFMIATGQSGNPLSGSFSDLLEEWRAGNYLQLGNSWGDLERNGLGKLTLIP